MEPVKGSPVVVGVGRVRGAWGTRDLWDGGVFCMPLQCWIRIVIHSPKSIDRKHKN